MNLCRFAFLTRTGSCRGSLANGMKRPPWEMVVMQCWRKAYDAIKDTTSVILANLNSNFKDLNVAIVKATNHVECSPNDRLLWSVLIHSFTVYSRVWKFLPNLVLRGFGIRLCLSKWEAKASNESTFPWV